MKRIVYLSKSTSRFGDYELTRLLDHARHNNHQRGLSGLLIFHRDLFFQVLEGPDLYVDMCMNKIMADPRHSDLTVLDVSHPRQRAFPQWRMGFHRPSDLRPRQREAVFPLLELMSGVNNRQGDDPAVRNYVRGFLSSFRQMAEAG